MDSVRQYGKFVSRYESNSAVVNAEIASDLLSGRLIVNLKHTGKNLAVSVLIQYLGDPAVVAMRTRLASLNTEKPESLIETVHALPRLVTSTWDNAWTLIADQLQSDLEEIYGWAVLHSEYQQSDAVKKAIRNLIWSDFKIEVGCAADVYSSAEDGEKFMKTLFGNLED